MNIDIEKLAIENGFIPHEADDGECYADLETLKQFADALLEDKEREIVELKLHNNDLREAGKAVVERWDSPNWSDGMHTRDYIYALKDALSKTPVQHINDDVLIFTKDSLQEHDNDVIERCAKVCESLKEVDEFSGKEAITHANTYLDYGAEAIRALKGKQNGT